MGRTGGRRGREAEERVFALVREHAYELLRFARRFSLCEDDAQDAYQRALEILVRQLRRGTPPQNTLSWLRTVVRHEASQVREERERRMSREQHDVEQQRNERADDPAERAERFERLAHTAEALRRLKPQEVTALVLRAEGLSYEEICERTSWSYTRTNRCVTEGRRALVARLRAIESGEECERWLPLLSMLADGEASARELTELRPHLRSCAACRATLRGFHEAPGQVGALVPAALLPVAVGADPGGTIRHVETMMHWLLERATVSAMRMQGAIDALPGTKIAAVAASTVAVAGSGAAIERAATNGPDRDRRGRSAQVAAASAATRPTAMAPAASAPLLAGVGAAQAATPPSGSPADRLAPPDGDRRTRSGEPIGEFALEPIVRGGEDRDAARRGTPPPPRREPEPTTGPAATASAPPSSPAPSAPPAEPAPAPATDPAAPDGEFTGFESTTE
ncbi:sigma-70 family RNA polymerase sigma factor [Conexibacter woesei]|uniref:RNA polymerase, sigma-24 subunit, ECF subfamily n=1 Tax=Conexibacter woesei (strain DSM 14684 / CCUG 47730 / CIP 108061 / JCM 11494 / NBRC 100937 / ID131577) TaxID=469383 RepID=D3F274_CONWI|nr:sigma-70 family RNA polymerase sigma factor [Conexibacter woesei]ADB50249.1 RNA polymerase, sigma-24 subunit, ECF subfamily [Conexibacter woesei DSM 14684]